MRIVVCSGLLLLSLGCAAKTVPVATPPMPDDLSTANDGSHWEAPVVLPPPPIVPVLSPTPGADKLPLWEEGKEYKLEVAPGWPLTIELEPGEQITGLAGGDRPLLMDQEAPPWELKRTAEGVARPHVFVTVTKPGLTMGLAIATDQRTYYLTLKSVNKTAMRQIRWRYPQKPVTASTPQKPAGPLPQLPYRLHVGYWLRPAAGPEWMPMVYDDGQKMYLTFPVTTLYQEVPLLRGVGVNGPYLLNSRQVGRVVVVDQLAPQLELRHGIGKTAEVLTITRGTLDTITCPGHSLCPQW